MEKKTKEIFKIFLKFKLMEISAIIIFIILTIIFGNYALHFLPQLCLVGNCESYGEYFFFGLLVDAILAFICIILGHFIAYNWDLARESYNSKKICKEGKSKK